MNFSIPMIFDKLFGISYKTSGKDINQLKQLNIISIVDLLGDEKANFEDLDNLLHLLIPTSQNEFSNI